VSQIEGRTQEILLESLGGCQRQASATFGADIMPTHRSNESISIVPIISLEPYTGTGTTFVRLASRVRKGPVRQVESEKTHEIQI
jgi:hypothetical protein